MPHTSLTLLLLAVIAYFLGPFLSGCSLPAFLPERYSRGGQWEYRRDKCHARSRPLAWNPHAAFGRGKRSSGRTVAGRAHGHDATAMMLAAIAALIGHCYPIWLRFKGGKGVATGLGVFTALAPLAGFSARCGLHHRRSYMALCIARFDRCSCLHAAVCLFVLGAWPRASDAHSFSARLFATALVILQTRCKSAAPGGRHGTSFWWQKTEDDSRVTKIAILGGGSWGTGLAVVLAHSRHAHEISLWVREPALAEAISITRENKTYLAGCGNSSACFPFPRSQRRFSIMRISSSVLSRRHTPAQYSPTHFHILSPDAIIVSATKGLEPATHLRHQSSYPSRFARSGFFQSLRFSPDHRSPWKPRAVNLRLWSLLRQSRHTASGGSCIPASSRTAEYLQEQFSGPTFRLYTNDDVLGVELCRRDEKCNGHSCWHLPGTGPRSQFAGRTDHSRTGRNDAPGSESWRKARNSQRPCGTWRPRPHLHGSAQPQSARGIRVG